MEQTANAPAPSPARLYDTRTASQYLGGVPSESALRKYRQEDIGPKFIRLGRKLIRYTQASLNDYATRGEPAE